MAEQVIGAAGRTRLLEARAHPVATLATMLVAFAYSGIFIQMLPVTAPAVVASWGLPSTAMATPMAAILLGSGLGTICGGVVADMLGRRKAIGATLALLIALVAAASMASTPLILAVIMFFGGLAMGAMYASAMALVTELVPDRRRPLIISFTVASLPVGLGICSLASALIVPLTGWSAFFQLVALAGLPVLLAFLCLVPESPSFIARDATRMNEYRRVIERLGLEPAAAAHPVDGAGDTAPREPLFSRFGAVIRANPRAAIGIWGLFAGTYIFGNAILSWLPTALNGLGYSMAFASGSLTAWSIASMTGTPIAGWCLYRFGVRTAATIGALLGALTCLGLMLVSMRLFTSELAVLCILPLGGFASAGVVTALYTLVAEAYPPAVRAMGIGLSDALGRVGGTLAAFSGIYIIAGSGAAVFFGLLVALMLAIAAYLAWLHPYGKAPE